MKRWGFTAAFCLIYIGSMLFLFSWESNGKLVSTGSPAVSSVNNKIPANKVLSGYFSGVDSNVEETAHVGSPGGSEASSAYVEEAKQQ